MSLDYRSEDLNVPETSSGSVMIEHQDVVVSVLADDGTTQDSVSNVHCYLFTANGAYTGIRVDTDDNGRAVFSVPSASYKVRADYLGLKYWTEEFVQQNSDITILHGSMELHVTDQSADVSGARIYLFSESGSYLGRYVTTDEYGNANFTVPEGSYTVRIDVNGEQHWSDVINIIAYQSNQIEVDISEAIATNNPRPERYDGEAPVYRPMLALAGSLDGLFTSPTVEDPRTYYFISDHLGSGQLLVDQAQQVVWQGDYRPFGQVDVVVDRVNVNLRFPGQYFDSESGLHYNWHRFYDPETGRYMTSDPIGLRGGINLYAYVGNDPVNFFDPWGLMKQCPLEVNQAVASSDWRRYPRRAGEKAFHCGYRCYLENRDNLDKECTKDDPINECCYDETGLLVTPGHQINMIKQNTP